MATSNKSKASAKAPPKKAVRSAKSDLDRRWSILLFGLGLFFLLLALVPGDSGWALLRGNVLFGGLGISGWLLGPLMVFWALQVSLQKPLFHWVVRGCVFMIALSGLALVFGKQEISGLGFGEVLKTMQAAGAERHFSGGLLGLLLGGTLMALIGRTGARIVMVLLLLVALMVLTGTTPGDVVRFVQRRSAARPRREKRPPPPAPPEPEYEEAPQQAKARRPAAGGRRKKSAPRAMPPLMGASPRRAGTVDIDLGPEAVAAEEGLGEHGEVQVGPGGTFGLNPLGTAPAAGGEEVGYDGPLLFERPTAGDEFNQPQKTDRLLFGQDDPFAKLGGPDPVISPDALPEVEYVPPPPAPVFDLFDVPAGASEYPTMPEEPVAVVQPVQAAPAAVDIAPAAADLAPPAAGSAPAATDDDSPPFDVPAADTAAPAPAPAEGDSEVDRLIERAVEEKESAKRVAAPEMRAVQSEMYLYPSLSLFEATVADNDEGAREEMRHTADRLVETLNSFGVRTSILDVSRGPSVTRYEVQPQAGVKISKITSLSDDIALNLAAAGVRIEAPIPGKPAVGIEIPNRIKSTVSIRSILESAAFQEHTSPLAIALGKDIAGDAVVADLTKMPHLLIAGSTGSGKSVCVNATIMSFLYKSSPEDVRLLLIDPKMVELAEYNGIPHLLMPVVTEPRKAAGALGSAVAEMERRYRLFAENKARDIVSYNKVAQREGYDKLPYIAIVIDELADLMMTSGKEVEDYICRIAQKARAAGMHLIVATQRPSVDVITGLIKANIPSRIAFAVSSQVDSRTILDSVGADKLLGMGDMLFMPVGANKPVRVQGTFVKDREIRDVLSFIKQNSDAEYDEGMIEEMERRATPEAEADSGGGGGMLGDQIFIDVVETALEQGSISTSFIQRRFSLGYARAGRIMDEMERLHIVGPPSGSKPREVLIGRQQWLEMCLSGDDRAQMAEDEAERRRQHAEEEA